MSNSTRILLALIAGLGLGIAAAALAAPAFTTTALLVAEPIGGLWLDALRMTIIPLILSLLITGIATGAEAASAGRLTIRTIILFFILWWTSALIGALLLPLIVGLWPLPAASGEALRTALGAAASTPTEVPGIGAFLRGMVPTNVFAAAANDAILPLIIFTILFAFAVTRLRQDPRKQLTGFFSAVRDAMLVIIGWVLAVAPIGVFALAFAVGARAGAGAAGALAHYVVAVSLVGLVVVLLAYAVAVLAGGISFSKFARAVAPAQAVAASTRSSLASLPPMLAAAERLGISIRSAGVVLPLAVVLFRATGPAVNLAVALYVAHWFRIELGPFQIAAGVAVATITTVGAVGLPGQVSFIASIAPIAMVMGVPVEPLALLVAVETIPDTFRTIGNVTMDVAVTAVATRGETEPAERVTDGVAP